MVVNDLLVVWSWTVGSSAHTVSLSPVTGPRNARTWLS